MVPLVDDIKETLSREEFALTYEPSWLVTVAFNSTEKVPSLLPYILTGCDDNNCRNGGTVVPKNKCDDHTI